jgi:hypothetical protein
MTLSAHKALFSLIVLAAMLGFGWILIVYVLSFHAAQWAIDQIEGNYAPRRPQMRRATLRPVQLRSTRRISRA